MKGRANAQVQSLVERAVEALGYECVGVEYLSQGRHSLLRVYIDIPRGVTLDDCERVSHQLSGVLDVEDLIQGRYSLEVSSPGLDRPLFTPEHFARFAGSKVRVHLHAPMQGRRKLTGVLLGVREESVVIVEDGGEIRVPLDNVEQARLVPEI